MKTVFADVKLWVLGRSEPLPLVLQSMMSGITCQLITKTGRAFFYTLFTYKEPPSSFILTILKKARSNKLIQVKLSPFTLIV